MSNYKNGMSKEKDYNAKSLNKNRYKRLFGIELDFDLGVFTYDAIQWWKWTYDGTPTGKRLSSIPIEIGNNENNLIRIIRYVLTTRLNCKSKEDFLKIGFKTLKKYKIFFTNIRHFTMCDLLNKTFPEYNFKEWDFIAVPHGFWEDINNADDYLRWFVKNKLDTSEMNIKTDIPKIFSPTGIRDIDYRLNNIIKIYKHYDNFYQWLNKVFPEWNLNSNDFNLHLSFDGFKFLSREECIVYEYIKRDLELNIDPINAKRSENKYFNILYDETYYPDFLLKDKKFDKPVILEYFGMYSETASWELYVNYRNKVKRKIEYFSNRKDIYFIGIFPKDLRGNFKGIKSKLNNLILIH